MDYKKYKLPAGVAITISLFFAFFFKHASYSSMMIVEKILGAISAIMLVGCIITRKKIKIKLVLPFIVCMFVGYVLLIIDNYFRHNHINDNIISLLIPVILIAFLQIVSKYEISNFKGKKKIKSIKIKYAIITFVLIIAEISMIYSTLKEGRL